MHSLDRMHQIFPPECTGRIIFIPLCLHSTVAIYFISQITSSHLIVCSHCIYSSVAYGTGCIPVHTDHCSLEEAPGRYRIEAHSPLHLLLYK